MTTLKRLNELSRQTLANYTRHSARELEAHSYFQGYSAGSKKALPGDNPVRTKRMLMRRIKGLDAATKRLAKEEILLEKAPAKKPASGAVTVTVKTGASGGQAAGGKDNKKKKKSSAAGSQKSMGKTLRDLLAHHDSASTYHRQKAAEHGEFQVYHNKARDMRHLGPLHKKAQEAHENLRHIYHKLSNATYNAIKRLSEPKEKKKK